MLFEWLKPQVFFAPEEGAALPGSRQAEEGAPAVGDEGAARKQVEAKLKDVGQGSPAAPQDPSATLGQAPPQEEYVKLKMSDGTEQEVKLEYALQLASRTGEIDKRMAELQKKEEQLRPYEAIDLFVRANPEKNGQALKDLVAGKAAPPGPPPAGDDVFSRLEGEVLPDELAQLKAEVVELRQYQHQEQQYKQAQMVDQYRHSLLEEGKAQMDNFKVFTNQNQREIGEWMLKAKLENPEVLAKTESSASIVADIAKNLETGVQGNAAELAARARRSSQLAGGPVPGPVPKGDNRPAIAVSDRRLGDSQMRRMIIERMGQRGNG